MATCTTAGALDLDDDASWGRPAQFADVQVSDDGIGGFALRARVTNNGQAVAGALWTATLFLDGVVVATLNGSAQGFAAGATVTADFWSADPFGDYDTVEFQVDGQF